MAGDRVLRGRVVGGQVVGGRARRSWSTVVLVVGLMVGTGAGLAGCPRSASNDSERVGQGVFGSAPPTSAEPSEQPSVAPPPGPSPSATESPTASGVLAAAFSIDNGLIRHEIKVTITNRDTVPGTWSELVIVLKGLDLVIGPAGGVSHDASGRTHTFHPEDPFATLPPGGEFGFTLVVNGTRPEVASCKLDGNDCVGPVSG